MNVRHDVLSAVVGAVVLSTAAGAQQWVGTWSASPCGAPVAGERTQAVTVKNETLRLIVHTSIGGSSVRIRLSNAFGTEPLVVASAHLALRDKGDAVRGGSDRALMFSGRSSVTIPAGATVLSDAVSETVPALSDVAVSLFVPASTTVSTLHYAAHQTSYAAAGDQTGAASLSGSRTLTTWPYLSAIEVSSTARDAGAIVTLGSSTTDGSASTADTNRRWPDEMARRLQVGSPQLRALGVLNQGIGGNRVLHDGRGTSGTSYGVSASARFDRDVLSQAGVKYVVIFEGGNDINHPGESAPIGETITADDLIAGYKQLIARAHEHGIRVILGTITPFEGINKPARAAERETLRAAVNQWIMTNTEADGRVDFSKAIADPSHPTRIAAQFDSGDHLHPNDAGYKTMAQALDLKVFLRR